MTKSMEILPTSIDGVIILQPTVFFDGRGFFLESWNEKTFCEAVGVDQHFVQDNHSRSRQGTLRGLHYQYQRPQGKLVRVVQGNVLDIAVDLRASSPTFGQHVAVELSGDNHRQLWIPSGFAHGFVVRSESADFLYKTTDYYVPQDQNCIRWDDSDLNINWQLADMRPHLSTKDQQGQTFLQAPKFT